MRAKLINEKLEKVFKPKSKKEIFDAIGNIKKASYRLSSFLTLPDYYESKVPLKDFCESIGINTKDYEISRISDYFVDNVIKEAFYKSKDKIVVDNVVEYLPTYDIIRYRGNYICFPKNKLGSIIQQIIKDLNLDI